jgi:hypothetical protein
MTAYELLSALFAKDTAEELERQQGLLRLFCTLLTHGNCAFGIWKLETVPIRLRPDLQGWQLRNPERGTGIHLSGYTTPQELTQRERISGHLPRILNIGVQ